LVALHVHNELEVHAPFPEVYFETDEPYCHLFPLVRGSLEEIAPDIRNLSENPDLQKEYDHWMQSRNAFNASLAEPGSKASQDKWQKSYFRGTAPSGAAGPEDHRGRLRLKPFAGK